MNIIDLSKDIRKEFNKVRQEIGHIAKDMTKGLAEETKKDLISVHEQIINNFYDSYNPTYYDRSYGLYKSLISSELLDYNYKNSTSASVHIGSFSMQDYYPGNITPDNIFDLMWNKGVRGLPKRGLNPLSHTYSFNGTIFYEGDKWENPYWDLEKYENVFKTKIKLGRYTSVEGVPNIVMTDIVNNWGKAKGKDICNKLLKEIRNKYK